MEGGRRALEDLVAAALAAPASPAARRLADAVRARHAGSAASVVFYGSCLRDGKSDGVHDFYLMVDGYRDAYSSRALALANALLPPNVFYLELPDGDTTLRAKVAVVSRADLARGCAGETWRAGLWARFSQPVAAVWVRDGVARKELVAAGSDAVVTAVRTALVLGASSPNVAPSDWQPLHPGELWRGLFRATYDAELRPERRGASDALYAAQPDRYDALLDTALDTLARAGEIEREAGGSPRVRLLRARRGLPVPLAAKTLAAVQLAKSGFTFGDWLPYALWKLERHSGVRLEASPRQRRHPWLFGWPLVLRALRSGALR